MKCSQSVVLAKGVAAVLVLACVGCAKPAPADSAKRAAAPSPSTAITKGPDVGSVNLEDVRREAFVAPLSQLQDRSIRYDPAYLQLSYPDGDVPAHTGVCVDVVLRAFMQVGVSLQREVHLYRKARSLSLDRNIDHRRVRNVGPYLSSKGLEIDARGLSNTDFQAGDIIWWKLSGIQGMDHVGIVMPNGKVLHNIGHGQCADALPHDFYIHKVYRLPEAE